jgi:hypothetical protein
MAGLFDLSKYTDVDISEDNIDEDEEFRKLFEDEQEIKPLNVCQSCNIKLEKSGKEEMSCRQCGLTTHVYDVVGGIGDNFTFSVTGPNAMRYKASIYRDSNLPKDELKHNNVLKIYTRNNKEYPNPFPYNILKSATETYCKLTQGITFRAEKCKQLMAACLHYECVRDKHYRSESEFARFMLTNREGISIGKVMMTKLAVDKMELIQPNEVEYTVIMHFTQLSICNEDWDTPLRKIIDIIQYTLNKNMSPEQGSSTIKTRSAATIKYYNTNVKILRLDSGETISDTLISSRLEVTVSTLNKFYDVLRAYPKRIGSVLLRA